MERSPFDAAVLLSRVGRMRTNWRHDATTVIVPCITA